MSKFKEEIEKIMKSLGNDLSIIIKDYGIFFVIIAVVIYFFKRSK
jgi:hypothetical protein